MSDGTIMFFCELCGGSVDVEAVPEGWDGDTSPYVCETCLHVNDIDVEYYHPSLKNDRPGFYLIYEPQHPDSLLPEAIRLPVPQTSANDADVEAIVDALQRISARHKG